MPWRIAAAVIGELQDEDVELVAARSKRPLAPLLWRLAAGTALYFLIVRLVPLVSFVWLAKLLQQVFRY